MYVNQLLWTLWRQMCVTPPVAGLAYCKYGPENPTLSKLQHLLKKVPKLTSLLLWSSISIQSVNSTGMRKVHPQPLLLVSIFRIFFFNSLFWNSAICYVTKGTDTAVSDNTHSQVFAPPLWDHHVPASLQWNRTYSCYLFIYLFFWQTWVSTL